MTNVSPKDLAVVYLQGWSASTLRVYSGVYREIVRYGSVLGKHWYRWNSGDVSSYLINGSNLMPNSIKKFGAVLSLFFGCCDRTSPAVGPLVSKIKVGFLNNVTLSKRAPKASLVSREFVGVCFCPFSAPNRKSHGLENHGFAIVMQF